MVEAIFKWGDSFTPFDKLQIFELFFYIFINPFVFCVINVGDLIQFK
jgi:hypothetical protein